MKPDTGFLNLAGFSVNYCGRWVNRSSIVADWRGLGTNKIGERTDPWLEIHLFFQSFFSHSPYRVRSSDGGKELPQMKTIYELIHRQSCPVEGFAVSLLQEFSVQLRLAFLSSQKAILLQFYCLFLFQAPYRAEFFVSKKRILTNPRKVYEQLEEMLVVSSLFLPGCPSFSFVLSHQYYWYLILFFLQWRTVSREEPNLQGSRQWVSGLILSLREAIKFWRLLLCFPSSTSLTFALWFLIVVSSFPNLALISCTMDGFHLLPILSLAIYSNEAGLLCSNATTRYWRNTVATMFWVDSPWTCLCRKTRWRSASAGIELISLVNEFLYGLRFEDLFSVLYIIPYSNRYVLFPALFVSQNSVGEMCSLDSNARRRSLLEDALALYKKNIPKRTQTDRLKIKHSLKIHFKTSQISTTDSSIECHLQTNFRI